MVTGKDETVRSMCRKGFGASGGDHVCLSYMGPTHPKVRTRVSHGGSKDLDAYLIREMAKDCHLSKEEFIAFAKCQLSKEEYRRILIDKGIIKGE